MKHLPSQSAVQVQPFYYYFVISCTVGVKKVSGRLTGFIGIYIGFPENGCPQVWYLRIGFRVSIIRLIKLFSQVVSNFKGIGG